jgi:hypothetical protein
VIPREGTWTLSAIVGGAGDGPRAGELSDAELDKLHRLAALVPPATHEGRAALKRKLATLLRLVQGVHALPVPIAPQDPSVDARPLAHDPAWSATLPTDPIHSHSPHPDASPSPPFSDGQAVLHRERQLLDKVDASRKYAGYLVVNRT